MPVCRVFTMKIISRFSGLLLVVMASGSLAMLGDQHASDPAFSHGSSLTSAQARVWFSGSASSSVSSGSGEALSSTEKGFSLPIESEKNRTEVFRSSVNLQWTEFDWRGVGGLKDQYLWLSMPIHYRQDRGQGSQFLWDIEPGIMSDTRNLGADHLALNTQILGRQYWRRDAYWQYGLIVDRAFGDYDVRPVMGAAWQASKRTWIELGFPEVKVEHTLSHQAQAYFNLKPAGGVWRQTVKGQKKASNIHYINWQGGVGVNFHWRKSLWLSAEVGVLKNRQIKGRDNTSAAIKANLERSRYWRLAANLKY